MTTKITFLLPVPSHARYQKRVNALEKLGVRPTVLSFEREYYPGKPWAAGYQSLGTVQNRSYFVRLLPILKALPLVRAAAKHSHAIYAFGLDTLLLGWLASRTLNGQRKIIFEVGDIQNVMAKEGWVSRSLRSLERYLVRRADLLVVTSEAFVTGYYQGIQGLRDLRYQVIENKLDTDSLPEAPYPSPSERSDGALRIGYFGLLRCGRSWEILKEAVERGKGQVHLYMRGVLRTSNAQEEEIERTAYVDYDGPYVVPDDLPTMYGQVDMVWAAYPYQGTDIGNWQWARTNRFYEASFFQRPMIVQAGTQDCRMVDSFGLGTCLDFDKIEESAERILQIGETELAQWQRNLSDLPTDIYTYSDEHQQLFETIQSGS